MTLRHINNLLFVAIAAITLYIIAAPITPLAVFWIEMHTGSRLQALNQDLTLPAGQVQTTIQGNRLVIPAMLLNTQINEGKDLSALRTGPWHRPYSSTPADGGNTVIAGHRFTYSDPQGTFYFLNKVRIGDHIGIFWQGKRYIYRVAETKTVPATDTSIEASTTRAQLTLYTCTPLWLPKDRLVVIATLETRS